MTTTTNRRKR